MPSKKKKYNARFPAGRIKKIMQSDEEIGKVAQAVPVIISRTLELFVESLLTKTLRITNARNAKTLSPSHMRQCIVSEKRFDFLKELVRNIPDISVAEEAAYNEDDVLRSSPEDQYPDSDTPYDLSLPSTSMRSQANGTTAYMRSMSLNNGVGAGGGGGAATKRQFQPQPAHISHPNPTSTLPAKLARSESTPAYTPRGRPPNHLKKQSVQLDTAIPAPICSYELNKPIVKIDYSHMQMQMPTANLCTPDASDSGSGSGTGSGAFNFDIAAPVINIDLTNIVAAGAGVGAAGGRLPPASIGFATATPADNNNVNQMAGKSSAPIIPKATAASATPTETVFELDEDYDNI
ncbi:dr1-associated corepressor [Drosophila suzukii]|uniref:Dr1-associated corepressor n=1 Tax=Drosophila suzukii TaxID=28584 RepID=A0AB39Z7J5_DROSZ|nr:dr1-associated corepressor [Drosophila suzukii]